MTEPRDVHIVIDEIIDHIDYVLAKTRHLSAAEFRSNRDIRQSVERSLEIVSEASRSLPTELKELSPEVPWRKVADFGNVLRHVYFAVNPDIVWRIASEDLGALRQAIERLRDASNR